jgi:cyclophilin family peptidyl-prolyl cis-trans isomerase
MTILNVAAIYNVTRKDFYLAVAAAETELGTSMFIVKVASTHCLLFVFGQVVVVVLILLQTCGLQSSKNTTSINKEMSHIVEDGLCLLAHTPYI